MDIRPRKITNCCYSCANTEICYTKFLKGCAFELEFQDSKSSLINITSSSLTDKPQIQQQLEFVQEASGSSVTKIEGEEDHHHPQRHSSFEAKQDNGC